jgi:hypothetical protein
LLGSKKADLAEQEEERGRERERQDGYKKGGPATEASCERGGEEDGGVRPRAALLQRQGLIRPGAQRGGARRRERLHTGDDRVAAAWLDDPAACARVMLWCLISAII